MINEIKKTLKNLNFFLGNRIEKEDLFKEVSDYLLK